MFCVRRGISKGPRFLGALLLGLFFAAGVPATSAHAAVTCPAIGFVDPTSNNVVANAANQTCTLGYYLIQNGFRYANAQGSASTLHRYYVYYQRGGASFRANPTCVGAGCGTQTDELFVCNTANGACTFGVSYSDNNGQTVTVSGSFSAGQTTEPQLTVSGGGFDGPPPLTTTQAVPSTTLTVGTAATVFTPVTASGGTAPLSFGVSPTLPAGLSMAPLTGQISGTPTAASTATTYTVTATDSTSGTAQTSSKTFSLTVSKGNQTVAFTSSTPASPAVGGTYVPTASATSGLTPVITVDSSSAAICTIAGGTVTFNAAGTCVLNANHAGDANYNPASQVQQTATVGKGNQTVAFTSSAPASPAVGGTYVPTATATSGLTPVITIDASSAAICSIAGGTVTFNAAGSCVLNANQAGNSNYNAASQVQQTATVGKGNQTVAFTSTPSGPAVGSTYVPAATATSGLTPVITVDASSAAICTIAGGTVTFNAAGTCVLNANQAGNANYNAASQVQQTATVGKSNQTVAFTSTASSPAVGGTYAVTATATSGLTPVITVDASSAAICTIAGGTVTFNAAGSCVLNANQAGNANYNTASQVQQTATVGKSNQTVAFTSSAPASPAVGGTYAVTATATSGLTPIITVDASTAAVCTIAGGTVTFNATGSCVLNANQAGNANYNTASQVQQTATVGKALPGVGLVASTSSPLFNTPVSFTATMTGGVTPTGTVTFKDGATVLATVALSGASASFSISSLTAGPHSVIAMYNGDTKNLVASSSPANISVGTRPDPVTSSAAVRGIVTSQVTSAIRFGQAQTTNITSRLEQLHDLDDGTVSVSFGPGGPGNSAFADTRSDGQTFSNRFGSMSATSGSAASTTRNDVANDTFSGMNFSDAAWPGGAGGPQGAMAYANDPLVAGNRAAQSDSSRAMSQLASALPGALNAFNKYSGLPFHLWASGTVGFGNLHSDGTTSNRFNTSGLSVGFDSRIAENLKAGIALGMAFDRATIGNDGSQSKSKSYSAALYSSWRFMPRTYLDMTGGIASLRSDMVRFDANGSVFLNGRRDGTNLFGSVALTHNERYGAWKVSPYVRVEAVQTTLNAYSETGSNIWALNYDRMTATTVNGVVGSRVSYLIPQTWGILTPGARFEYRHAFESGFLQTLNYADLVGIAPGYTVAGTSLSRDAFTAALMLRADMISGWKADIEYLVTSSNRGVEGQRIRFTGGYRF